MSVLTVFQVRALPSGIARSIFGIARQAGASPLPSDGSPAMVRVALIFRAEWLKQVLQSACITSLQYEHFRALVWGVPHCVSRPLSR